jgi:hypothetical protein
MKEQQLLVVETVVLQENVFLKILILLIGLS